MEKAYWIDWRKDIAIPADWNRVYFGHETCQELLPTPAQTRRISARLRDRGVKATLVTPFLSEWGLLIARRLVDSLLEVLGDLEVVCSDWGLLHCLAEAKTCAPVVGRVLAAQHADPRVARALGEKTASQREHEIQHHDGTRCLLKRTSPSQALSKHYRGCWIDKPPILEMLSKLGIGRCELSNISQGLEMESAHGLSYSLHVPEVLLSVMKQCPSGDEDFDTPASPRCEKCEGVEVEWALPDWSPPLFRRDNALYYVQPHLPRNLDLLPIDRIVTSRVTAAPDRPF